MKVVGMMNINRGIDEEIHCCLFSLWRDVTYYLKSKQMDKATGGKTFLEQRQRQEAKERVEKGEKWQTKVNDCLKIRLSEECLCFVVFFIVR